MTNKTMIAHTAILSTLQKIAPEAHIGGGAVRDTLLQKQIKDIDLFMDDEHVEDAATLLRSKHGYVKVGEWEQYLGFSDPAMTRVAKFEKWDETILVCIIGLGSAFSAPKINIARFDFGLCMVAFDGKDIIRTAEFDSDVAAQTFTLLRADDEYQFAYSMSRYEKITAGRYAGWSLAIPDEFKKLAMQREFSNECYQDYEKGVWCRRTPSKPKLRVVA